MSRVAIIALAAWSGALLLAAAGALWPLAARAGPAPDAADNPVAALDRLIPDPDNSAAHRPALRVGRIARADYDRDNDQLIEISNLAQLDAVRYDRNGDGTADHAADAARYAAAFPNSVAGRGCPPVAPAGPLNIPVCIGYELTADLDFDTDHDGAAYTGAADGGGGVTGDADDAYYNAGAGWTPIGARDAPFTAAFHGNGHTISNLFINDPTRNNVGLFGFVNHGGRIERLHLRNLYVAGRNSVGGLVGRIYDGDISRCAGAGAVVGNAFVGGLQGGGATRITASRAAVAVVGKVGVGGLAGGNGGRVSNSSATGPVAGHSEVGGLLGDNGGVIAGSWATGAVAGDDEVGGLAGKTFGPISDSHAAGPVVGRGDLVGGLVGHQIGGAVSGSYATGAVTGHDGVGGLVGGGSGAVSGSYATGAVTGHDAVGGLVGNGGPISGSYATGAVAGNASVGGLVGWAGPVIAAYAAGPVAGNSNVGGLVGGSSGPIAASYASGAVAGDASGGGLVGYNSSGVIRHSYWDIGTTGQSASAGSPDAAAQTTRALQSPRAYAGIYANWNVNLDGVPGNDDPWDFGDHRQYPVLQYDGLAPDPQRQTAIHSDHWNAPVVGEPVTAILNLNFILKGDELDELDQAAAVTWQWQSSAAGASWTDLAGATAAAYIPVAADAANGGHFLRARVAFTAAGRTHTLLTRNTARVLAAAAAATAGRTLAVTPMVGVKLRYDHAPYAAAGADHRTPWRWRRCADAAMTAHCQPRAPSHPDAAAYTEYTPAAGADNDVGQYLQAYAYYADRAHGNAWTRVQTPILGPVVAAPVPSRPPHLPLP